MPLVFALVPLKCPSRNLQFPHRVPTTMEKTPWCLLSQMQHTGLYIIVHVFTDNPVNHLGPLLNCCRVKRALVSAIHTGCLESLTYFVWFF